MKKLLNVVPNGVIDRVMVEPPADVLIASILVGHDVCARLGPHGQNREGVPDFRRHLDGRVVWVEQVNPRRGAKLRRMFERIDWGGGTL